MLGNAVGFRSCIPGGITRRSGDRGQGGRSVTSPDRMYRPRRCDPSLAERRSPPKGLHAHGVSELASSDVPCAIAQGGLEVSAFAPAPATEGEPGDAILAWRAPVSIGLVSRCRPQQGHRRPSEET
jgi:hypothetical protein